MLPASSLSIRRAISMSRKSKPVVGGLCPVKGVCETRPRCWDRWDVGGMELGNGHHVELGRVDTAKMN